MKQIKDTIWSDTEEIQAPPTPSLSKLIHTPAPIPAPSSMPVIPSKDANIQPAQPVEINIKPTPFKPTDAGQLNTEIPATDSAKTQIQNAETGTPSQDSASPAMISALLPMESA